jgi:hypothetical protein
MKVAFYCICGGAASGEILPGREVEKFERAWRVIHTGKGHADTDAATATQARRRQRRAAEREQRAEVA